MGFKVWVEVTAFMKVSNLYMLYNHLGDKHKSRCEFETDWLYQRTWLVEKLRVWTVALELDVVELYLILKILAHTSTQFVLSGSKDGPFDPLIWLTLWCRGGVPGLSTLRSKHECDAMSFGRMCTCAHRLHYGRFSPGSGIWRGTYIHSFIHPSIQRTIRPRVLLFLVRNSEPDRFRIPVYTGGGIPFQKREKNSWVLVSICNYDQLLCRWFLLLVRHCTSTEN